MTKTLCKEAETAGSLAETLCKTAETTCKTMETTCKMPETRCKQAKTRCKSDYRCTKPAILLLLTPGFVSTRMALLAKFATSPHLYKFNF